MCYENNISISYEFSVGFGDIKAMKKNTYSRDLNMHGFALNWQKSILKQNIFKCKKKLKLNITLVLFIENCL